MQGDGGDIESPDGTPGHINRSRGKGGRAGAALQESQGDRKYYKGEYKGLNLVNLVSKPSRREEHGDDEERVKGILYV
jgi:hypothetical protein